MARKVEEQKNEGGDSLENLLKEFVAGEDDDLNMISLTQLNLEAQVVLQKKKSPNQAHTL
jgi:hypothetical protein